MMYGQQMPALPNDPAVKVGKLDNGLTYYIRHNANPAERAEFYLATNVGAIQEAPDQDGLAHFLEHMCFNGTEHFPDKAILDWLRSIGAEFGRNINASTGFEETQYMLNNIPVSRETVVDTCLMILCDYSHYVLNDPVEIDKERGVIIEERRQRRNAQWRTMERSLPYYFGDTKMAGCTLIGRQESLETFAPESLVNFYHTWYHPGNQAVIVVGDVDVDRTEGLIKDIFGAVPACENPTPKAKLSVPANAEPVVGIITDPETTNPSLEFIWRSEAAPEDINATIMGEMSDILKALLRMVMRERFDDITSDPAAPYINGSLGISSLIYEDIDAVLAEVALKEDNILGGAKAFYTEVERLRRYGVTDAEFDRAKTELLSRYESAMNNAATRRNAQFIRPLIQNFFDKKPYMDPQDAYQLAEQILTQVNAKVLSMVAAQLFTEEDMVILYSGPEKEGVQTPSADEILALIAEVKASEIAAPAGEEIASEFLDASKLKGGKVKKSSKTIYGATEWILSNGVKVLVLPTDYTKDQILFGISKDGGLSLISDEDMPSFDENVLQLWQANAGVGQFSGTQVSKMLSGKNVSVYPYIDRLEAGINGRSTVKDLETGLQLLYLYFVNPRFDQKEYDNGIAQIAAVLPNLVNQPNYKLQKALYETLYSSSPRKVMISPETLEKASLQTIERNYRKLFANAAGLTMTIVGDVDLDTLKPLVEKYIGSLPKGRKASSWKDDGMRMAKGQVVNDFAVDMQTPKSTVVQVWSADIPYSAKAEAALDVISYILDIRYTNSLREDEGGTYGAHSATSMSRRPEEQALIQVAFDCKPSLCDRLRELAIAGIKDLAENGPTEDEMTSAVLNLKKNLPENRINNGYWRGALENYLTWGEDREALRDEAIESITPEDVCQTLKAILDSGNLVELVMRPDNAVEAE